MFLRKKKKEEGKKQSLQAFTLCSPLCKPVFMFFLSTSWAGKAWTALFGEVGKGLPHLQTDPQSNCECAGRGAAYHGLFTWWRQ